MASTSATPVALSFDSIDDLIYSARVGDLGALKEDITKLSQDNSCAPSAIIESAIDIEEESEGGTGACLLHWPAANGNIEILKYLLETLKNGASTTTSSLINHKNNSGNTPLHWAALNTHLECVKALVEAGADVNLKNDAGHDAAFLAERAEWSKGGDDAPASEQAAGGDTGESAPVPPMTEGLKVVELLLEKAAEVEESSEGGADAGSGTGGERMDGVEKTGSS